MIRFVTPTDFPGVIAAEGPLYDSERVLDVGFRMLRALHGAALARDPATRCVATLPELLCKPFFNGSIELAMRTAMEEGMQEYEISDMHCTLEVWPYHVGFSPFGGEALMRREDRFITTGGNDASALDAVPQMNVMRSLVDAHGVPEEGLLQLIDDAVKGKKASLSDPLVHQPFDPEDHAFFLNVWKPFIDEGVQVDHGAFLIRVTFPDAVFGRGRGPVRIRVANPVP